jgi:glycosyltransferase involved in cell wall biosynthesis
MISVIIVVRDAEEPLLRTLAALAPLAAEGLIADVIVADLGSRDATRAVAEAAGCTLVENCGNRASAIARAVELARKSWLFALTAGDRPDAAVADALRDHIAPNGLAPRPAAFLALPAGAGILRRACLGAAFDALGITSRDGPRVLAPRDGAHLLALSDRRWRGVRLRARIGRAVALSTRP